MIWPSKSCRFTSSSTSSSWPSGFAKDFATASTRSSGTAFMRRLQTSSGQAIVAFRVVVQRAPEQAVDGNHEQAHRGDAQHDAVEITGGRGVRNIGPETVRAHLRAAPARQFGDDG